MKVKMEDYKPKQHYNKNIKKKYDESTKPLEGKLDDFARGLAKQAHVSLKDARTFVKILLKY